MRISLAALDAALPNPCACQDALPGVKLIPGLPICDPVTGGAPGCSAAQAAIPFCSGIAYGQPGYADCVKQAEGTTMVGPFQVQTHVDPSNYESVLASLPPPPPPAVSTKTTGSSAPPASSSAAGSGVTQQQITNPPAAPSGTPAGSGVTQQQITGANQTNVNLTGAQTTTMPSPFAFLTETMIDGIPNWVLIAGAVVGGMLLFSDGGGRRR